MIKKLLSLLILSAMLTACGGNDDPWTPNDGNNGGGNNSSANNSNIASIDMGTPTNPIPQSAWAGDWNDKNHPNYVESNYAYNPVEGYWMLTEVNGSATTQFLAYEFRPSRNVNTLSQRPREGEAPNFDFTNYKPYTINNIQIRDSRGYIYNYAIAPDRSWMTLFDGANTYRFIPYDNNGVWMWNGDWNAPHNPYFSVYNGKYNPIAGTWRAVSKGKLPILSEEYYIFDDDLSVWYYFPQSETSYRFFSDYKINDTGINFGNTDFWGHATYKYWIENNTLYMQGIRNNRPVPEILKLIRLYR